MISAVVAMIIAGLACSTFFFEDALATETAPVTRIFVLNAPSSRSAGSDSILTFDALGKAGILFGTQNRVEGTRDLVCSPMKPEPILLSVSDFALRKNELLVIGAAGDVVNVIPGPGLPGDQFQLTFDPQGNLYFATGGKIFKNGTLFATLPGVVGEGDLAADHSGNLYVTNTFASQIFRIDATGAVTLFADASDGLNIPIGLAVDSANNLFVANNTPSAAGSILKFHPSGTSTTFASNISFQPGIRSMIMSVDGADSLYVPLENENTILKFDSTGNSSIFADERVGLNAPFGIVIGSCPVKEPLLTVVNNRVSLVPIVSTFQTTADTSGCPAGFLGKFGFSATFTHDSSSSPLTNLMAQVKTLTNGNLLQNADGGPFGAGATLSIPGADGFADGVLSSGESVNVPFSICLKSMLGFNFLVDILGIGASDLSDALVQR
jgi:hypothetical protein